MRRTLKFLRWFINFWRYIAKVIQAYSPTNSKRKYLEDPNLTKLEEQKGIQSLKLVIELNKNYLLKVPSYKFIILEEAISDITESCL